jgi:hypothetical protein
VVVAVAGLDGMVDQKPSMQAALALLDRVIQADLEFTITELPLEHITVVAVVAVPALTDTISIIEVRRHAVVKAWHRVLVDRLYIEQAVAQAVIIVLLTAQQV